MRSEHLDTSAGTADAAIQTVTSDEARQVRGGVAAHVAVAIGLGVALAARYMNKALDAAEAYDKTKKVDWKKLAKSAQDRL